MSARSLLAGATGQIGRQMLRRFGGRALPTTRRADADAGWCPLDLETLATVGDAERALAGYDLDAIYCLAGMTNVEACEDHEEQAMQVNAVAPGALAAVARMRGIPFVYFSTEYVFDGRSGPYSEGDEMNPLSVYGKSKAQGERAVGEAYAEALILRTTVVYGPDPGAKNFIYSLMRNLQAGLPMRVPLDQVSTPTYNLDLALVAQALAERGATGVMHVCGPELLSRLEFARRVAAELGLEEALIVGVPTADLGQRAPRPLDAGLLNDRLRKEHPDLAMRSVAESMVLFRESLRQPSLSL